MRQELRANALARIAHGDLHVGFDPLNLNLNLAAFRCELDGIGQQIPDNLLHALRIAPHRASRIIEQRVDFDLPHFGGKIHRIQRGTDDIGQIDALDIELQVTGDNSRNIEDIFNQLGLTSGIAFDRFQRPTGALRV